MLFYATEVDVQFMQMLQKHPQRRPLGHLGKSVHILGKALAAIAKFAIRTGNISVRVVDVARKQHPRMHFAPVGTHLLAVLAAGVEVGDLVSPKYIVHIFGELGFQGSHDGKLLADKNLGEQIMCPREHHGLFLEVLNIGTLGEELGHIVYFVARLAGKPLAGTREDGRANEHGHVREIADQLLHEREVLRAVVLGGDVYLQKSDVNRTQIIVIALGGVADEQLALGIVVFQPILEGTAHEAAAYDSDVDHFV